MTDDAVPPEGRITTRTEGRVLTIAIDRPRKYNGFTPEMIQQLAEAYTAYEQDDELWCAVLCAEGKHFSAGADFSEGGRDYTTQQLYDTAVRIFRTQTPVVAAIQGAAVGGGLGLALSADFRVASPEARFSANFARLGFHQGFGLSVTLPRLIGEQKALEMFYTGRRVKGDEAHQLGLIDVMSSLDTLRQNAWDLAREIAVNSPLALTSTRDTLRTGLAEAVKAQTDHELAEQTWLRKTDDFREGVAATHDRRLPNWAGK